jgi:serine/threonine protein kinase
VEPLGLRDPSSIGRYRLAGRLGRGGMGSVFLGHAPDGRPAAIKVIGEQFEDYPEALARFRREVENLHTVRSSRTATLIDYQIAAAPYWLATEYIPGPTLAEQIVAEGAFSTAECLSLAAALAQALADVHAYAVRHRDLTPHNVILSGSGPMLIDFGLAFRPGQEGVTQIGRTVGTPGVTAPEALTGQETGPAADVFGLGTTLAFAATARAPYGMGNSTTIAYLSVHGQIDVKGVEPALARLIQDCVNREPSQRPTPGEIIERCRPESVTRPIPAGAPRATSPQRQATPPEPSSQATPPAAPPKPRTATPPPQRRPRPERPPENPLVSYLMRILRWLSGTSDPTHRDAAS